MDILKRYIEKHCNYPAFFEEMPEEGIKNVIVIPCCNEPEVIKTLDSLKDCSKPKFPVEIIVVVNSSENAEIETIKQNLISIQEISNWKKSNNKKSFTALLINIDNIPYKTAGVGYARKTGMDEAVRRFLQSGQNNGVITCLDADSVVATNYLLEIEKLFLVKKNCNGCSIHFEHPITENGFTVEINKRITEYELYLRFYKLALEFTGFPYYHFTIGSSFSVSTLAYCKSGGMNKKQAGEDFYFLQKVMPLGNYFALNSTSVYPSPRPSDRVPFGTGAFISQYLTTPDKVFLSYNFETFINLKLFFDDIELMFKVNNESITKLIHKYHKSLQEFLELNKFEETLHLINSNSSHLVSFKKRFFQWFDAFKILKYLNFAHQNYYEKELVTKSLTSYFNQIGQNNQMYFNDLELLNKLRIRRKKQKIEVSLKIFKQIKNQKLSNLYLRVN